MWGKLALLERGAFAGLDALLTSHADYQNGALSRPCLACVSSELVFTGVASHGGAVRRHNALEALERVTQAIDRLRGSRFDGFVIGHVVRAGGLMPSITPEEARVWLTVRHESFEAAWDAYQEIVGIARDAARAAAGRRPRAARRGEPRLSPERRPGAGARREPEASSARRRGVPTTSPGWRRSPAPVIRRRPSSFTGSWRFTRTAATPTGRTTARRAGASRSAA